jgi:Rod binding domain-containing protein
MDLSPLTAVSMNGAQGGDLTVRPNQTPAQQRNAVAGQFEAIMLRQMLGDSVGAMLGGDNTPSGSVYGYLLTDVFANKLAAGGGMGLAKVIAQQLGPREFMQAAGGAEEDTQ